MLLDPARLRQFEALTQDREYRERECTPYLENAIELLLGQTPVTIQTLRLEHRSYFGRSDFIISADLKTGTGATERFVDFWELKAPQCALMENDDAKTRFRPTTALIKAETQLLHYIHEARGSDDFKQRFAIRYPVNIRIGGIVIGRDDTMVLSNDREVVEAARHSFRIRDEAVYRRSSIRVITWSRILDYVSPQRTAP